MDLLPESSAVFVVLLRLLYGYNHLSAMGSGFQDAKLVLPTWHLGSLTPHTTLEPGGVSVGVGYRGYASFACSFIVHASYKQQQLL